MTISRNSAWAIFGVGAAAIASAAAQGCSSGAASFVGPEGTNTISEALGAPSPNEVALDPTTVPKFAQDLVIPEVWTATPVTQNGTVVQNNYTLSVVQSAEQVLPPPLPASVVLGY